MTYFVTGRRAVILHECYFVTGRAVTKHHCYFITGGRAVPYVTVTVLQVV